MKNAAYLLLIFNTIVFGTARAVPPIPEIPQFPSVVSNGNIYHVDQDISGNNNGDGSQEEPWATLQYGVDRLVAGDTLIVHEASTGYNEFLIISNAGTDNNWITIKGAEGENVELKGGKIRFNSTAKYIHFANMSINAQNAGWMLLEIMDNSQHLAIDNIAINCQSSSTNYTAVWANAGVNNVWFRNMDIHHCGYSKTDPTTDCSGICLVRRNGDADPLLDNITFLNVTVRDNKGDGIGSTHVDNVYFDGSTADNNTGDGFDIEAKTRAVLKNSISRNNGPEDQGVGFKTWSKESWFINCISSNNHYWGIHNKPRHLESSIYVLNSTLVGNNKYSSLGQIRLTNLFAEDDPDLSSTDIYLLNNLFHTINTPGVAFGDWSNQTLVEEDNNYYFSAQEDDMPRAYNWAIVLRESEVGDPNRFTKGYTFEDVENGNWYKATGYGNNDIGKTRDVSGLLDPGFVRLNGDFHLLAGSEAINAGIDVGLTTDIDGNPIIGNPDIGAYEFQDIEQLVLSSIGAQDGWVLESGETRNAGGSGDRQIRFGDDNKNRQYKAIVSFDASALAAGATVHGARLELTRGRFIGDDEPYSTFGTAWVDVSAGGFGDNPTLSGSDFDAPASVPKAGQLSDGGKLAMADLNAAGRSAIEGASTVQLRIAFQHDDNDDRGNDYTGYYSGDDKEPGNHPRLVIDYVLGD